MEILFVGIISYLMGSIPFALLLTKIFLKKDIREIGSGNIGATNALRTGNKIIGYTTLIFDILKAIIPVIYVKIYFPELVYVSSLCAFLGHVFPIWLKFKGGKGVATYLGILFAINLILPLVFILFWIIIILISKYASLASLISALAVLVTNIFLKGFDQSIILFLFLILIIYSHRTNIQRLKAGNENKINL